MSVIVIVGASYMIFGTFVWWLKIGAILGGVSLLWLLHKFSISLSKTTVDDSRDVKFLGELNQREIKLAKNRSYILSGIIITSIVALAFIEPYSKLVIWLKVFALSPIVYYFYTEAVLQSHSEMVVNKIRQIKAEENEE